MRAENFRGWNEGTALRECGEGEDLRSERYQNVNIMGSGTMRKITTIENCRWFHEVWFEYDKLKWDCLLLLQAEEALVLQEQINIAVEPHPDRMTSWGRINFSKKEWKPNKQA